MWSGGVCLKEILGTVLDVSEKKKKKPLKNEDPLLKTLLHSTISGQKTLQGTFKFCEI